MEEMDKELKLMKARIEEKIAQDKVDARTTFIEEVLLPITVIAAVMTVVNMIFIIWRAWA